MIFEFTHTHTFNVAKDFIYLPHVYIYPAPKVSVEECNLCKERNIKNLFAKGLIKEAAATTTSELIRVNTRLLTVVKW
jgi:hypothetical protein